MVQQTSIQKTRLKFIDDLFGDQTDRREIKKDIDFLIKDYTGFIGLAASLSSHSKWIPYPFLIDRIKKVADELRSFADLLRGKILDLGGQIPPGAMRSAGGRDEVVNPQELQSRTDNYLSRENVGHLVKDMEEHSSRWEILQHQKNLIKDKSVAKLINVIIIDMQRQKGDLIDIVMRLS